MRLVCPNCGAQYEVDDAVIPPNGRDVQCSNCAHSWFQPSKAMLDAEANTPPSAPVPDDWESEPVDSATTTPEPTTPEPATPAPEPIAAETTPPDLADTEAMPRETEPEPDEDDVEIDWDFDKPDTQAAPEDGLSDGDARAEGTFTERPATQAPDGAGRAEASASELDATPDDDEGDIAPGPELSEDGAPSAKTDADAEEDETEAAIAALLAANASGTTVGAAPKPGATPRKALDDSLLSVLREEAEREAAQRRAEGLSELQVQDELALDDAQETAETPIEPAAKLAAQRRAVPDFSDLNDPDAEDEDRVADLHGSDDDPAHTRGRERLPNIDEINDTLTATSDRAGETIAETSPEMVARRRSGFSRGFFFVIVLAGLLAGLYIYAPRIGASVPAASDPLASYVATVDQGRIWLNDQMATITEKLQGNKSDAQ